eukprot:3710471-Prymnesium_polylepis.1
MHEEPLPPDVSRTRPQGGGMPADSAPPPGWERGTHTHDMMTAPRNYTFRAGGIQFRPGMKK